jgi:hypothetical protein
MLTSGCPSPPRPSLLSLSGNFAIVIDMMATCRRKADGVVVAEQRHVSWVVGSPCPS